MNRHLTIAAAFVVLPWLLPGCVDEEAAKRSQASKELQQAMAQIDQALIGFAPVSIEYPTHETVHSLADWQRQELLKAADQLQKVVNTGPAGQQLEARRLLATAQLTLAREQSHQAFSAWSGLTPQANTLVTLGNAVVDAHYRAMLFSDDATLLGPENSLLARLTAQQGERQTQLDTAKAEAGELDKQIATLNKQRQDAIATREQSVTEAQKIEEEAFAAKGQDQIALYTKASDIRRQGQQADTRAELAGAQLTVPQSRARLLAQQVEHVQQTLDQINTAIAAAKAQQKDLAGKREEVLGTGGGQAAAGSRNAMLTELQTRANEVAASYAAEVQQPLAAALARLDDAQSQLQKVTAGVSGVERQNVDRAMFAVQLAKLHTLVMQANIERNYASTLQVVSDILTPVMATPGETFASRSKIAVEAKQQATAAARVLMEEAGTTAQRLPDAADSQTILNRYNAQLEG